MFNKFVFILLLIFSTGCYSYIDIYKDLKMVYFYGKVTPNELTEFLDFNNEQYTYIFDSPTFDFGVMESIRFGNHVSVNAIPVVNIGRCENFCALIVLSSPSSIISHNTVFIIPNFYQLSYADLIDTYRKDLYDVLNEGKMVNYYNFLSNLGTASNGIDSILFDIKKENPLVYENILELIVQYNQLIYDYKKLIQEFIMYHGIYIPDNLFKLLNLNNISYKPIMLNAREIINYNFNVIYIDDINKNGNR